MKREARAAALAAMALALATASGCRTGDRHPPSDAPTLGEPPSWRELVDRHNARLADVAGFYATANVEVTWTDEQGQPQREVGEGNLIFTRPDQVALTFEKLGKSYLWLGGGPERSWMLWGGDISRAYIARNENIFNPQCDEFPIPLLPAELIDLYGVFDLPAEPASAVQGDQQRSAWVVTVPGRWCHRRLWLDAASSRPVRVELFDADSGRVWAGSDLSEYRAMSIRGVAPGRHPLMPTRVEVRAGGEERLEGTVRLSLFNPADVAPGHTRINPALFDFDAISRSMRPREVIVLDAACERPAVAGGP